MVLPIVAAVAGAALKAGAAKAVTTVAGKAVGAIAGKGKNKAAPSPTQLASNAGGTAQQGASNTQANRGGNKGQEVVALILANGKTIATG
jgi:hypothetical protein